MKEDIKSRADVELLVNSFYDEVRQDPLLGPVFSDIAHVNWDEHLPRMVDFWDHILFQSDTYAGNPMRVHQVLHGKYALASNHFKIWKQLFLNTVDRLFAGEIAELAKQRAVSIATVMEIRIAGNRPNGIHID